MKAMKQKLGQVQSKIKDRIAFDRMRYQAELQGYELTFE